MRFLSLFSGIEAASMAWLPLGWEAVAFAEIEAFPRAVLAHHYPEVPNLGDVLGESMYFSPRQRGWFSDHDLIDRLCGLGPIDLVVGGSPCQSFSLAGKRLGLADPRGNLALHYLRLVGDLRPRWFLFENVPGLLSSGGGWDLGALLGAVGQLGYGWAYRVLDAQFYGVPQRRRRVFLVGHLGDWRRAVAVLFEPQSLLGHPAAGRKARPQPAPIAENGSGALGPADVRGQGVAALTACGVGTCGADDNQGQAGHLIATTLRGRSQFRGVDSDCTDTLITHTLCGEGFDASEDGTGRGTPLVPVAASRPTAFDPTQITSPGNYSNPRPGDPCHPLASSARPPAVAFCERGRDKGRTLEAQEELAYCLANPGSGGRTHSRQIMTPQMAVRRLTPRECERLQGFPDDYTRIPMRRYARKRVSKSRPEDRWERRPDGWWLTAPDGLRYRALGNSMAVPVMRWIGERINAAEREAVA